MAHIEKYKAHSCGHILAHYRRDPSSLGRANIDPSRSARNLSLTWGLFRPRPDPARVGVGNEPTRTVTWREGEATYAVSAETLRAAHARGVAEPNWDVVRRRIEDVDAAALAAGKRRTRKDAVVLADLVVTLPQDVPAADEERFWLATYAWLAAKVGHENVVCAYVHMDEVGADEKPIRDHMHMAFTPVLGGRFNFKKLCDRKFYQTMHKSLGDALERELGYRPQVQLPAEEKVKRVYSEKAAEIATVREAAARAADEAARAAEAASAERLAQVNAEVAEAERRLEAVRREEEAGEREAAELERKAGELERRVGELERRVGQLRRLVGRARDAILSVAAHATGAVAQALGLEVGQDRDPALVGSDDDPSGRGGAPAPRDAYEPPRDITIDLCEALDLGDVDLGEDERTRDGDFDS